ncbi:MAG: glycine zipper 2TM domain-containing protein [Alphaproteobacteria bacterium]|nr:glycine zipper 2TM domain-containing protein [Alphaproteobacteria bacterium]
MRKLILAISALSVAVPAAVAPTPADARRHHRVYRHYAATCRHHSGTTGAIVGGVGGALIGSAVTHHGLAGPLIGGAGGALLGRHIERHSC